MVRAKFVCQSITERAHWDKAMPNIKDVKLTPVVSGSDENKAFYAATPSGEVVLGTCNAEAAAQFTIGAAYYIDFTPVS